MDLHQLESFVAVAEEESFTYAAMRLKLTQPGVSAQIKQLEHELGIQLFQRGSRQSVLTDAGSVLLLSARKTLLAAQNLREEAADLRGVLSGTLAIGTLQSAMPAALAQIISDFHVAHPQVRITLAEDSSPALIDGVLAGKFDVVLAGLAGPAPKQLVGLTVFDEAVMLAMARRHPLAGKSAITITELAEVPIIALPSGSGSRSAAEQIWKQHGVPFRPDFEASAPESVVDLAARGLGIAVINESAARANTGVKIVPIGNVRSRADLLWRRAPGPAAVKFVELSRLHFERSKI